MKRFIAVTMVLMLVMSCMPVSARTLQEILLDNGVEDTIVNNLDLEVNVPIDITEKFSSDSKYVDGPILYSQGTEASVDVKAVVDLAPVKNAFDKYIAVAMLAANGNPDKIALVSSTKVSGTFVVNILIPADAEIPENYINAVGFSSENGEWEDNLYKEVSRTYTEGEIADQLEIVLEITDPANANKKYMTAAELIANKDFYFGNLEFTCPNIVLNNEGTYKFEGSLAGVTSIENLANIAYEGVQKNNGDAFNEDLTATVIIKESEGGSPAGPTTPDDTKPDDTKPDDTKPDDTKPDDTKPGANLTLETYGGTITGDGNIPTRQGFEFRGWYYDAACTKPVADITSITEDITIYAGWTNLVPPATLKADNHDAYVIGYPDGNVRPQANITRDEVATIFYRLLKDEVRSSIFTENNNFVDVPAELWSAKAVSTMANGGFIKGDAGVNTFRPTDAITRAEFVAIAARFLETETTETNISYLTDINGHWGADAIKDAVRVGWIAGYDDNTFRPDQYITRAEAITIINRILVRYVNEEGLVDGYVKWPDNAQSAWYYYNVIEATNSHSFDREADKSIESWKAITENKVWTEKSEHEDTNN
ncbi:MAG: S-layer homology domain-containing protein [Eubacteriales bacterium]|nr:S-layer homology domain-containing protein [Eubacteriales bacterium]